MNNYVYDKTARIMIFAGKKCLSYFNKIRVALWNAFFSTE